MIRGGSSDPERITTHAIGDVLPDGRYVGPNGPIKSSLPFFAEWQTWTDAQKARAVKRAERGRGK